MNTTHLQEKERTEVAGHLENKRGIYQMVLSWKLADGSRGRKSISTGLPVKGNKKRAESMLSDKCAEMEGLLLAESQEKQESGVLDIQQATPAELGNILFADFIEHCWLESLDTKVKQKKMKLTTYGGYWKNVVRIIAPYFRMTGVRLKDLTADDINEFYEMRYETVKPATVEKQHANIHSALKYAVKKKFIQHSVMDEVERPHAQKFIAKFLKQSEAVALFEAIRGHKLEIAVILGAFYGLRRSEVVGVKWSAIDFEANSITVEHTVTVAFVDGKNVEVAEDTTKSKSSYRTLPLVPLFRARLLELRKEQDYYRKLCGKSYDNTQAQYLYVDQLGRRVKPNYITSAFPKFMEDNGFRRLRFHDLRHPYVKLTLKFHPQNRFYTAI